MVIGTGQGQLDSPLQTGSSSLDLVRVLVEDDVILRLCIRSFSPLLEEGAKVVTFLVVLPNGLSLALPHNGEVLFIESHGLKELDLLKTNFFEKLGISFVMLEY